MHCQSWLILTILLCNLGNDFVELREKNNYKRESVFLESAIFMFEACWLYKFYLARSSINLRSDQSINSEKPCIWMFFF